MNFQMYCCINLQFYKKIWNSSVIKYKRVNSVDYAVVSLSLQLQIEDPSNVWFVISRIEYFTSFFGTALNLALLLSKHAALSSSEVQWNVLLL